MGLGVISGALGVAQGLYSGISGYKSGKKQEKAYKEMARRAKEIGKLNADEINRVGTEEQKSMLDLNARRMARIESMYSKSGLLLTGTPATAIQSQKRMDQYALNEHNQQVQFRAKMEKLMAANQAAQYMGQAKAAGMNATTALIGGLFGAAQGGIQMGQGIAGMLQQSRMQTIQKMNAYSQAQYNATGFGGNSFY